MLNETSRDDESLPPASDAEPVVNDELHEYAEAARRQAWQDPLQSGR